MHGCCGNPEPEQYLDQCSACGGSGKTEQQKTAEPDDNALAALERLNEVCSLPYTSREYINQLVQTVREGLGNNYPVLDKETATEETIEATLTSKPETAPGMMGGDFDILHTALKNAFIEYDKDSCEWVICCGGQVSSQSILDAARAHLSRLAGVK